MGSAVGRLRAGESRATGKSPEPADRNVRATLWRRFSNVRVPGTFLSPVSRFQSHPPFRTAWIGALQCAKSWFHPAMSISRSDGRAGQYSLAGHGCFLWTHSSIKQRHELPGDATCKDGYCNVPVPLRHRDKGVLINKQTNASRPSGDLVQVSRGLAAVFNGKNVTI